MKIAPGEKRSIRSLYLSDLPNFLTTARIYDLVIFSRSAKSLQIVLNKLESFCENADLSENLDKTKIMIFNNCGKSLTTTCSDTVLMNWKSY